MEENSRDYKVERFEAFVPMEKLISDYFDYEETLSKCQECSGYCKTWSCPELEFDPEEFLKRYSRLHLIVDKVDNAGTKSMEEATDRLFSEKGSFDKDMRSMEEVLQGSYALAAQECVECTTCARQAGKPCIHPEIMRYSLEAIGCFPVKMSKEELGIDILWSNGTSIPPYYLLVAGVLEP